MHGTTYAGLSDCGRCYASIKAPRELCWRAAFRSRGMAPQSQPLRLWQQMLWGTATHLRWMLARWRPAALLAAAASR